MLQNISVPDIGEFDSVEIIEVLIKVGDQISKDDPIVTLESDKSSVEVPSPFTGKITELSIKIGDRVSKGSLLAKLENVSSDDDQKKKIDEDISVTEDEDIEKTDLKNIDTIKNIKNVFAQPSYKDDIDPLETNEWIDSLNSVIENDGATRASYLLGKVINQAIRL